MDIQALIEQQVQLAREQGLVDGAQRVNWGEIPFGDLLQPPARIPEVVRYLPRPGLVVIFGAPGTLKSLLVADLAVCVAAGRDWLEPEPPLQLAPFKVEQTAVVWVDQDNGAWTTRNRFSAVLRGHGITRQIPLHVFTMPNPPFSALDVSAVVGLRDLLRARGAGLAVLDNLGTALGDADENAAEMARVMANLRWIAEQANTCLVVIHHQRKANGTNARKGETLRGHSSIEAALDLALLVERDDEFRDYVTLRATKARHAEPKPWGARLYADVRDGLLLSARFVQTKPRIDRGDADLVDEAILAEIDAGAWTQQELIARVKEQTGVGKPTIARRLNDLRARGVLTVERGDKNRVIYRRAR